MPVLRPALALFATLLVSAAEAPLKLPAAATGGATLAAALQGRRSVRALGGAGLTLAEAGQLLWAAQGENRPGKRTVPSAHGRYPLELHLLSGGSGTLAAGHYRYDPAGHRLLRAGDGDPRALLGALKAMQAWIPAAPAVCVIAGTPARIGADAQALALTYYEAGAAAQALLLQATALGLGAGTATGVDLEAVGQALKLPAGTRALVVLPLGRELASGK
jgi:SagB-type dehydrogenase family enzyme